MIDNSIDYRGQERENSNDTLARGGQVVYSGNFGKSKPKKFGKDPLRFLKVTLKRFEKRN